MVLHTTDLDELQEWIGVPDTAVEGSRCVGKAEIQEIAELHGLLEEARSGSDSGQGSFARAVKRAPRASAKQRAIRSHARSYLYGDSTVVKSAKAVIEAFYERFEVAVWLFDVKVSSGSVLAFGPGSNVLLARELEIEEGGQIVSKGSLTVSVTTLRKTQPLQVLPMADLAYVSRTYF